MSLEEPNFAGHFWSDSPHRLGFRGRPDIGERRPMPSQKAEADKLLYLSECNDAKG